MELEGGGGDKSCNRPWDVLCKRCVHVREGTRGHVCRGSGGSGCVAPVPVGAGMMMETDHVNKRDAMSRAKGKFLVLTARSLEQRSS